MHNIQQLKRKEACELDPDWPGSMSIEEDPLAYLGILVDIIQEWDRYFVFKDLDREPLQGTEVKLGFNGTRVVVEFVDPDATNRAKKTIGDLNESLTDWGSYVEVAPI